MDILIEKNYYAIIRFPTKWQFRLLSPWLKSYDSSSLNKKKHYHYLYATNKDGVVIQKEVQEFLSKIFPSILKFFKINCVISPSVNYIQDVDLGEVSKNFGVPYVVIHKENLLSAQKKKSLDFFNKLRLSKSNLILTSNRNTQNIIKSTIGKNCNTKAVGLLRMEDFFEKLHKIKNKNKNRTKSSVKTITLFSFTHGSGIRLFLQKVGYFDQSGWVKLFESVHNQIINFADKNDKVKLFIKVKWSGEWEEKIYQNWFKFSGSNKLPKNCIITDKIDVHELILRSDLIIGFNSTAVLESGLKNIPVIIPNFCEAKSKYRKYTMLSFCKKEFSIVNSEKEFIKTVVKKLKNGKISSGCMNLRKKLFIDNVSDINKSIFKNYKKSINNIISHSKI